jgi:hypothetical protein
MAPAKVAVVVVIGLCGLRWKWKKPRRAARVMMRGSCGASGGIEHQLAGLGLLHAVFVLRGDIVAPDLILIPEWYSALPQWS